MRRYMRRFRLWRDSDNWAGLYRETVQRVQGGGVQLDLDPTKRDTRVFHLLTGRLHYIFVASVDSAGTAGRFASARVPDV